MYVTVTVPYCFNKVKKHLQKFFNFLILAPFKYLPSHILYPSKTFQLHYRTSDWNILLQLLKFKTVFPHWSASILILWVTFPFSSGSYVKRAAAATSTPPVTFKLQIITQTLKRPVHFIDHHKFWKSGRALPKGTAVFNETRTSITKYVFV